MANLKEKVLGSISGALGDIVFRNINGKNIVSMKAASVNIPGDPASLAWRGRFTMAAKISHAVSSNQKLKQLWKLQKPSGMSVFNYLIKTNFQHSLPGNINDSFKLVPEGGFPVVVNNADPASNQFELTVNAIGQTSGIDTEIELNIQALSVLFMSNPVGEASESYSLLTLSSDIKTLTLDDPVTFISPLSGAQTLLYNQYADHKIYFALVTLNSGGNVVHYSVTQNV